MTAEPPAINDAGVLAQQPDAKYRPRKAPNAFRTISEVADDLHIPQHVLRFWETKFPQVKPLKRGGGRRYYRSDDIALLRRISGLLYVQGYTIKGVQRLLRESGGQLSDNIPPPAADEKEGADTPVDGGLPVRQTPDPAISPIVPQDVPLAAPHEARAPVSSPQPAAIVAELERLRTVLRETLRDLEDLRATLG